ncbi:YhcH/YjgK/YiaL family protein [Puniceicoccaceae bacterium K14]|nr:YhcH/YjgK/YiaL family protein [Puniceicoccaceae bacterium K14]
MIVDHVDNWDRYLLGSTWEKVFEFLLQLQPDAEEKKYEIEGDDVFAIVMSYPTREEGSDGTVLEAHRAYADIHMTLVGGEKIACFPTHTLAVKDEYVAERDVEFFQIEKKSDLLISLRPGSFALLLPQDAHTPQLSVAGLEGSTVKKVVVKIRLDLLDL